MIACPWTHRRRCFGIHKKVDEDHLTLLFIFHIVVAALAVLGIGFLFLHYRLMDCLMNNPQMWPAKAGEAPGAPLRQFLELFQWFYVVMGVILVVTSTARMRWAAPVCWMTKLCRWLPSQAC